MKTGKAAIVHLGQRRRTTTTIESDEISGRTTSASGPHHERSVASEAAEFDEDPNASALWMDDPGIWGIEDRSSSEEAAFDVPKYALFFISIDNPIRRRLIQVAKSKYFERGVLLLIIGNCITLAMDSKRANFKETSLGQALEPFEYVFLALFTMEMLIKILAMGFVLAPGTYLRDGWNMMDFSVVVLGWLTFFPSFGNYTAIRVVRVFRPLRTITGVEGMRVLVVTLLKSLPMLLDVMILCAFAFFIFGIVGVQLFAGILENRCAYPSNLDAENLHNVTYVVPSEEMDQVCSGKMTDNIVWSLEGGDFLATGGTNGVGRSCPAPSETYPHGLFCTKAGNPNFGITSFDSILWAWLTIFQCISLEGWVNIMYSIQDSSSPFVWIYFTVLIVFGSFFAVNLALAVLYLYFTNSDAENDFNGDECGMEGRRTSTYSQDVDFQIPVVHRYRIARWCYRIQKNPKFEILTMILIVINTIVMAAEHHGMPDWQGTISENVNLILTTYFAFEMLVKVIGLQLRGYIEDKMNVFDGVVVIASLIEIMITLIPNTSGLGGSLSILRTFRLMRVFKLARSWKELNKIINTIFKSLASIAYLSLILLLFIFITALLGMQLFGYQFQFCDRVAGSEAVCPPGLDPLKDCPNHYDCYLQCSANQVGSWMAAPGAPYNGMAYCERFPRGEEEGSQTRYLAHVGKSSVSRHNFDNIFWSVITIFQILTGEDWNAVMYDGMRSTTDLAAVYFIMLVVLGNYIILNLFLAILLDNFAGVNEDTDESIDESDEEHESIGKIELPPISDASLTYNSLIGAAYEENKERRDEVSQGNESQVKKSTVSRSLSHMSRASNEPQSRLQVIRDTLEGKSLFLFKPSNTVRLHLALIVGHRNFEHVIIALICASSITLALDSPTLDPDSTFKSVLKAADTGFVVVFAAEAMLKIFVYGFAFNGKNSYLRNPWNVLDFVIVVVGIILLLGPNSSQLTSLRALRTLRALRPIRVASRNEGMKVVVNALFQSIPPIFNVLLVCLLFFLIFGILGINLLKGRYYYCMDLSGKRIDAAEILPAGATIDRQWCEESNHTITSSTYHSSIGVEVPPYEIHHKWVNRNVNFDNIGQAMLTLFEMATLEMWMGIMYDGIDAVGVDHQPIYNNNPYICIFFVLFIIVGSFFVLNLFVGVTIDKFNEMQQKQEGRSLLLTAEQEQWLHVQKLLAATRPYRQCTPPENPFRRKVFKVVTSRKFDASVMAMIMLNILFMAMQHADMTEFWKQLLFLAGVTFTGFFTIEAAVKLFALGVEKYFTDAWNAFDFSVVVFSIIGIVVDVSSDEQVPVVSLLRVFRVARMFRLIPKAKGLRTLFQTLVHSLPALVNVGSVLFLFFFIFAIMGMNLFGTIRHGDFLDRHANFETFPQALLLLFRMATGESWNGIMHDCMRTKDCVLVKEDTVTSDGMTFAAGSYLSKGDPIISDLPVDVYEDKCTPHEIAAILYFCVFVVVCAFILLNLVIAVILDNFQSTSQNEEMPVGRGHLLWFMEVWSDLDPDATCYIPTVKLSTLISELAPPLGTKGTNGGPAAIQNIIMSVDIPNRNNKVHFLETLHALAGRVAGTQLPEDEEHKIHEKMYPRLPDDLQFPKYTAAHFYAALYVQAAVRGFLARHQMKEVIEGFNEEMASKGLLGPPKVERDSSENTDPEDRKEGSRIVWKRMKKMFKLLGGNFCQGKVAVEQVSEPTCSNTEASQGLIAGEDT